jgi:hypothetical protein
MSPLQSPQLPVPASKTVRLRLQTSKSFADLRSRLRNEVGESRRRYRANQPGSLQTIQEDPAYEGKSDQQKKSEVASSRIQTTPLPGHNDPKSMTRQTENDDDAPPACEPNPKAAPRRVPVLPSVPVRTIPSQGQLQLGVLETTIAGGVTGSNEPRPGPGEIRRTIEFHQKLEIDDAIESRQTQGLASPRTPTTPGWLPPWATGVDL